MLAALSLCLLEVPAQAQSAKERNGEQLWKGYCASCHDGKQATQLLGAGLTTQAIVAVTRSGVSSMPSFAPAQVSDAELLALADWISHQQKPADEDDERAPRHATRQRSR